MKAFGFIYITTNLINSKRYIGQCKYLNKKWESYLGSGKHLKEAIRKYGKENFKKDIICIAFSKEDLNFLETQFIREFDAVLDRSFYNIASGGYATRGFSGKAHSDSHKKMMSEKLKGHEVTQKVKDNMSALGKKPKTEETKSVLRERSKNSWENGLHKRSKTFSLFGKTYFTMASAANDLGISVYKIRNLIKSSQSE